MTRPFHKYVPLFRIDPIIVTMNLYSLTTTDEGKLKRIKQAIKNQNKILCRNSSTQDFQIILIILTSHFFHPLVHFILEIS